MLENSIRKHRGGPDLAISQTCRQIHTEFFQHFYAHTQFIVAASLGNAFTGGSTSARKPYLPDAQLQLSEIRDVVIVAQLEEVDGGSYFDIDTFVDALTGLRKLGVAFTFQERVYVHRGNAGLWAESAVLRGFVCRIVQNVSPRVDLKWMDGSQREGDALRSQNMCLGPCAYIPQAVLQEMADSFAPIRGILAPEL
jgi:hypothetical protein